jgi:HTH-type transcriptional regulator/antitoxin HigA
MSTITVNPITVVPAWQALQDALPVQLAPIRTQAQYKKIVSLMNGLLDVVGDREDHPLAGFLDLVGQLVEDYEKDRVTIPEAAPCKVLRFLMDQHGLTQEHLSKELGGQSVVSAILNGKREINVRQAKALAARFHVPASLFV